MGLKQTPPKDRRQYLLNMTLAGSAALSGCLTLVIVLAAVLLGLWLDNFFGMKPVLTIILLVVSVPVSILAMLFVTRLVTSKIKTEASRSAANHQEEDIGKD